ncbi:hypothetical protein ACIBG8_49050 [Nonomuraea sp. NPDC050556]|uniref:hypothetical protein n=1 Tax=Nonomuraea sp. NPDC050556 TaxID=3364369 RepID=UPI0037882E47
MKITCTTAQDVLGLFNVTPEANRALTEWEQDPSKAPAVVPFVLAHPTEFLYQLTPADVERVCKTTDHALGQVQRRVAESVVEIVDWHPDFAFTHVLHYVLEDLRELPTWQHFFTFIQEDPQAALMLWGPADAEIQRLVSLGVPLSAAKAAMRWRVGNAYYSFLREIYVVTQLRAADLDVRLHPLADALFRVDFWCGRTVCSLLVKNNKFREDDQGRKRQPQEFLAGATPPFQFHKIQLGRASQFGVVHLPSTAQISAAATKLRLLQAP